MTKGEGVDRVISGYLDVKVPARGRKRPFGLWKSWRRYWVVALQTGQLLLSPSPEAQAHAVSLYLQPGATLCRTASRSRQFAFGAALGSSPGTPAPGLGAAQQASVYLATKSEVDTERWMAALGSVVLGLAKRRPAAAGPGDLLRLRGRRLSRSESDLLASPTNPYALAAASGTAAAEGPAGLEGLRRGRSREASPSNPLRGALRLLHGRRRAETLRDSLALAPSSSPPSPLSLLGGKIASGLISAGLGLMLSTPGGSEVEDNDEDDDGAGAGGGGMKETQVPPESLDRRRESGVSVASGIYEEIKECSDNVTGIVNEDRLYENTSPRLLCESAQYEDPILLWPPPRSETELYPPPLPPRSNLAPISKLLARPTEYEEYVCMQRTDIDEFDLVKDTSRCKIRSLLSPVKSASQQDTEPDYLPMSPARTICSTTESSTQVNIDFKNITSK